MLLPLGAGQQFGRLFQARPYLATLRSTSAADRSAAVAELDCWPKNMPWTSLTPDTPCVVFDTETNGLFRSGKEPRMVQLAWSICTLERGGIKRQSLIVRADDFDPNPRRMLSHGIDKARSFREGVPADSILREFISDVVSFRVRFLVAH